MPAFLDVKEAFVMDKLDFSIEHRKLIPNSLKGELWDELKNAFSFPHDSDGTIKNLICMEIDGNKFLTLELRTKY
jgi:hypothetical protein